MRRALITLTCVGLLLPGIALADLEEGTYAPDIEAKEWLNTKELFDSEYDEPVSLSELRGMVVVLYFWVSYDSGGESFMPLVNMVENSDQLGRRNGVFLMGVTEADRERVEEMVQEERLLFPIALESSAAEEYEIESFPRVVVVDPNGKIAFTGLFGKDDRNFIQKIVDVLAENAPHADSSARGGRGRAAHRACPGGHQGRGVQVRLPRCPQRLRLCADR